MFEETKGQENEKNLTDRNTSLAPFETHNVRVVSYGKTSKLITALYMVTDIMDKDEPLRNKLRTLGAEIISDIHQASYRTDEIGRKLKDKVNLILSFLEVASGVRMISEMNFNILKREFVALQKSIKEVAQNTVEENPLWLEEFLKDEEGFSTLEEKDSTFPKSIGHTGHTGHKRLTILGGHFDHKKPIRKPATRIGVQKGSTLLKALSDRIPDISKTKNVRYGNNEITNNHSNDLKNKRREELIAIIKDKKSLMQNEVSIKDIVIAFRTKGEVMSEKTLQRELVSLVSLGVLKKSGEKRWSRYSLK